MTEKLKVTFASLMLILAVRVAALASTEGAFCAALCEIDNCLGDYCVAQCVAQQCGGSGQCIYDAYHSEPLSSAKFCGYS